MKNIRLILLTALVSLGSSGINAAQPKFGVWLDGVTGPQPGDGILNSLNNAFGAGSYTLLSDADLSLSLAAYHTIIMSRTGANFGNTSISAAAIANIQSYVGAYGPTQGGVAMFTNDAKDNFFGATSGDPYDANLNTLFQNAATYAAATHHGFIGEFNGTVIGLNLLHLLPGVAGGLSGGNQFHYAVGPIGAGHPIDTGVSFPFVDGDQSPFLTTVTGADPGTIVDVYTSQGVVSYSDNTVGYVPAILANPILIAGGHNDVPDGGATIGLLGGAILVLAGLKRRLTWNG